MDMQTMKRVDRIAGVPLCALLKAYDRVAGRDGPDPREYLSSIDTPRIGVIKFWGMGSLILASPLFRAIKSAYPSAEVHLITLSQNKKVIELLGIADKVHYLELPEESGYVSTSTSILGFFASLSRIGLHAVIDLEYLSRFSSIVSYLTGAPIRAGFHSWDVWRGNLQTERRAFNPYWHATENFLNLHRALGKEGGEHPIDLSLSGDEIEKAEELLRSEGVDTGKRTIAVNANASTIALARRWPENNFIELVDRIVESGLGQVVLLGAPDEAPYVEGLKSRMKHKDDVISLAGKSSLTELVGVLQKADLLVTNDSGPLHLAGALGTSTVSFFGPETPELFGPRGEMHKVLYRGIDCSPCINIYNAKTVRCMRDEPECLTRITVDEAFEAVRSSLEGPA